MSIRGEIDARALRHRERPTPASRKCTTAGPSSTTQQRYESARAASSTSSRAHCLQSWLRLSSGAKVLDIRPAPGGCASPLPKAGRRCGSGHQREHAEGCRCQESLSLQRSDPVRAGQRRRFCRSPPRRSTPPSRSSSFHLVPNELKTQKHHSRHGRASSRKKPGRAANRGSSTAPNYGGVAGSGIATYFAKDDAR
jgi:hypothetical protein